MKESLLDKIQTAVYSVVNPRIGLVTSSVNSAYVFMVNYSAGFDQAIQAASRNLVYNLLMSSAISKLTQNLSKIKNPVLAWTLATAVPWAVANTILYSVHKFGGTPKPLESLIFANLIGLVVGPTVIYGTRKGYMK